MTMSRLKAYRRNALAIEDIKAELSGKYVADSISVCTPPSYTPHSTRIDGFLPSGDTLSLLCEQARLEREQRGNRLSAFSLTQFPFFAVNIPCAAGLKNGLHAETADNCRCI